MSTGGIEGRKFLSDKRIQLSPTDRKEPTRYIFYQRWSIMLFVILLRCYSDRIVFEPCRLFAFLYIDLNKVSSPGSFRLPYAKYAPESMGN